MQNRSFDIAGPNPTPEEQKYIDQQYTVFLDKQRRSYIAAALTAKQEQQDQEQQASLRNDLRNEKASMPMPVETPVKPRPSAADLKSRAKANCAKHSTFSCEWPVLSEKITNLKKALFGASQVKAKHGGLSSRGEASEPVRSAAR
jgi:ribosomal protein L29